MIHELIKNRFSPRAFAAASVDDEKIIDLFEAARWAPSAMNEQPWRFIAAKKEDEEMHNKLLSTLAPQNQVWAADAPLLVMTIAKLDYTSNRQLNRYAFYDLGAAVALLSVQAMAQGLYVHQMGGFSAVKARELFEIPESFEPVSVLAIGYKGEPDQLPENLKVRELAPRSRKPLAEILFSGKFGEPDHASEDMKNLN